MKNDTQKHSSDAANMTEMGENSKCCLLETLGGAGGKIILRQGKQKNFESLSLRVCPVLTGAAARGSSWILTVQLELG